MASRLTAGAAPFAPGGLSLGGPEPIRLLQSHVGAATGHRQVDACRGLRFPVERHVADGDRAAGFGAKPQQLVFDTEPGQPIAEIADGLVVGEIRLAIQRSGRAPRTTKPPSPSDSTVNPLSFTGMGRITGRRGTTAGCASRYADTMSHSANVNGRNPLARPSTPRTPANRSAG